LPFNPPLDFCLQSRLEFGRREHLDVRQPHLERLADLPEVSHLQADDQRAVGFCFPDLLRGEELPSPLIDVVQKSGLGRTDPPWYEKRIGRSELQVREAWAEVKRQPECIIIAGPNGFGKTTFYFPCHTDLSLYKRRQSCLGTDTNTGQTGRSRHA